MSMSTTRKIKTKANALQFKKSTVILGSMVVKNVKNQYRRSVLGIIWTVANPLLNMLVMWFVFSKIFGARADTGLFYPVYVLSGTIVFGLMRTATASSLNCMVDNYDLLTKTRVPYSVFPISQNLSAVVNFGFSLIALILLMLACINKPDVNFHWTMLMIVVPWLPAMLLFTLGMSFALCSIYVRFRDISHIYTVVLTLWNYVTPVFYSLETLNLGPVPMKIMKFNPMYHYVQYVRELLMGVVPGLKRHLICYGVGLLMFIIGYVIFRLSRKKFILYI